jgi:hypothetical protein
LLGKVFFITSLEDEWSGKAEEWEYEFVSTKFDIHASSYKLSIRKAKANYSFSSSSQSQAEINLEKLLQ